MSDIETALNLHPDPRCLDARGAWRGTWVMAGEKRRYMLADGSSIGSVFAWEPLSNQQLAGNVLYARISDASQAMRDRLSIEGAQTLARADGWIAATSPAANNRTIHVTYGPFTLCEVGVYTPDDWESLYALYQRGDIPYPWVAGPHGAAAGEKGPWAL